MSLGLADVNGSSFGPTIKAQLDEERARESSLEARGIGIVTSSGVLATLLLGLATFTRGSVNQLHLDVHDPAKSALILGVILFGVAALLGLGANLPMDYLVLSLDELEGRVSPEDWLNTTPVEAARRDAQLNVAVIKSARQINQRRAWVVFAGIAAEGFAVASVAVAVVSELSGLPA